MISRSFRRLFSKHEESSEALKLFQQKSQQRMRAKKFSWLIGTAVMPLCCFSLYDRLAALPEPLSKHHFPILSRLYIRKALLMNEDNIDGLAKDLDTALYYVVKTGYGSASPQATALLIYLCKKYVEDPKTQPKMFESALTTLMFKPHVGEALEEELARLEMCITIIKRLRIDEPSMAVTMTSKFEEKIRKCPPSISFKLTQKLAELQELHP